MSDLVAEVNKIKGTINPNVAALPDFKHTPSYFYEVDKMRDPFIAFKDGEPPPPLPPTPEAHPHPTTPVLIIQTSTVCVLG